MKIYLREPLAPAARRRLAEQFEITDSFDRPDEIDGIITRNLPVTAEMIRRAGRLKVISVHGTGTDMVDAQAAARAGVIVTSTPGQNAQSVAELTVAFLLALSRKLKYIDRGLQKGAFPAFGAPGLTGFEVFGKKLGLIGCGNVAVRVAAIMRQAFSCRIYCYHPRRSRAQLAALDMEKIETLQELFHEMDMVSVHCPLTSETRHMIDAGIFVHANPDLLFVNTARGDIVEQPALYRALTAGQIGGAASDVFPSEPPEKDNPLLALDNFIGAFHIGCCTPEALERVGMSAVENLVSVLGH